MFYLYDRYQGYLYDYGNCYKFLNCHDIIENWGSCSAAQFVSEDAAYCWLYDHNGTRIPGRSLVRKLN